MLTNAETTVSIFRTGVSYRIHSSPHETTLAPFFFFLSVVEKQSSFSSPKFFLPIEPSACANF